ncbi:MAG: DUF4255 domain-containing protein [Tannerellaceae bacterium]|nr:DUF4255 domain-containing protein [Tannerellaceae bacterium]
MIRTTLSTLSVQLGAYLKKEFQIQREMVSVKPLHTISPQNAGNEICLALINVERETGAGIAFNRKTLGASHSAKSSPSWLLNLYVLIAAIYSEKQYEESLQVLSSVILFLQKTHTFLPEQSGITLAIEPVNLAFSELSNLWSICGSHYYPSVVCKIRVLMVNAGEIRQLNTIVTQTADRYE